MYLHCVHAKIKLLQPVIFSCSYFTIANALCLLQAASVLDVKKEVHRQDSKLLPHLQRLVYQAGVSRTKLEDGCR